MMKTVYIPIQVPDNEFCWDGKTPCTYFDNTGGHGRCLLGIGSLLRDANGLYVKPKDCWKQSGAPEGIKALHLNPNEP